MKNDLISRQTVIDRLNKAASKKGLGAAIAGLIIQLIQTIPAVEAAPVVHAHWHLKDNKGNAICSNCNRQDKVDPLATHCRYCGAMMDHE